MNFRFFAITTAAIAAMGTSAFAGAAGLDCSRNLNDGRISNAICAVGGVNSMQGTDVVGTEGLLTGMPMIHVQTIRENDSKSQR